MAELKNAEMDLAAFRDDLAALKQRRREPDRARQRRSGGKVQTRLAETPPAIDRGARGFARAAEGERSVKAIGAWVEKQPVLALLIALGVGYVGARAFLR